LDAAGFFGTEIMLSFSISESSYFFAAGAFFSFLKLGGVFESPVPSIESRSSSLSGFALFLAGFVVLSVV
jgi:hypothetical protein